MIILWRIILIMILALIDEFNAYDRTGRFRCLESLGVITKYMLVSCVDYDD